MEILKKSPAHLKLQFGARERGWLLHYSRRKIVATALSNVKKGKGYL
jgi:hypothetical protein